LTQKRFKPCAVPADALRVLSRTLLLALLGAIVLAIPPTAGAVTLAPPPGRVLAGVAMGSDLRDITRRTGRAPAVWEQFVAWNHSYRWAIRLAQDAGTRLMLHLSTAPGQDEPGTISPGEIAAGRGDRWLLALRRDLAAFGGPVYLRFLGEMNNCHNAYAPLSCSGRSRGPRYSASAFVAAWRRTAVIMRSPTVEQADAALRRLHQPPLDASEGPLPPARIALAWTPMTAGSPMVSALDPARFWPGRRWLDWVGTSFYSRYPNFRWLTPFYERFAARRHAPFMFAEWAMWENGDPGFARQLLAWTRAHPRTGMLVYNQGKDPRGPFRLARFPAAAGVLRDALAGGRFSAR
jgi:hypothetical protein